MSNAHKVSLLPLKNQLVGVPFDSFHLCVDENSFGIQYGDMVLPSVQSGVTITNGRFWMATRIPQNSQLFYPTSILNPNGSTISGWFMCPQIHQSSSGNMGIQGNWYLPIIEIAPTENKGTVGYLSIMVEPDAAGYSRRVVLALPNNTSYTTGKQIENNTWYHFAIVFNKDQYILYINGKVEHAIANCSAVSLSTSMLMIGGGYRGQPNIVMDEILVDRFMRTSDEIEMFYNANQPFYNPYDYRIYAY